MLIDIIFGTCLFVAEAAVYHFLVRRESTTMATLRHRTMWMLGLTATTAFVALWLSPVRWYTTLGFGPIAVFAAVNLVALITYATAWAIIKKYGTPPAK